jgi:hypothetical protein
MDAEFSKAFIATEAEKPFKSLIIHPFDICLLLNGHKVDPPSLFMVRLTL